MLCAICSRHTPISVRMLRVVMFCVFALLTLVLAQPAHADTVTVTNTLDNGVGSLRQAVLDAIAGDVIVFDPTVFSITSTVVLSEQLVISKSITIDGAITATDKVTIRSDASYYHPMRAMLVEAGTHLILKSLSITGGAGYDPPIMAAGAAIYNSGILTITESSLSGNETYFGGAIYNQGNLYISNSSINNNFAADDAAAIYSNGNLVIVNSTICNNDVWLERGTTVSSSGRFTLINSTICGNSGSAVTAAGVLLVISSTITGNRGESGSGIYNSGTAEIIDSLIGYNSSDIYRGAAAGGGISNQGEMTVTGCTITGNSVYGDIFYSSGGGIENSGSLVLENTTVSRNGAHPGPYGAFGGGFINHGTAIVINSTFTENRVYTYSQAPDWAAYGGGIVNDGRLTFINSTIYSNTADTAADQIYNPSGVITAVNTIIGGSTVEHMNCVGPIVDGGYNIDRRTSCKFTASTSRSNTDPRLATLQMNPTFGNVVPTMALKKGSPAIDMGNDAACPATDARGLLRPQGAHCDIGAFEVYRGELFLPTVRR